MKLTYSLLAAAFACGLASAQTTAYTTPVGYVTLDVPAGADTTVGQPLHRPTEFAAASTGISGNTISVTAGALTAAQFEYAAPTQPKTYYVLVTGGSLAGKVYEIDSNTANDLTIVAGATSLQDQGFTTGTTFAVVPYWTLNTLFPGGAGVGVTVDDIFSPVAYVQFKSLAVGQDRAAYKTFFYYGGTEEAGPGWYDNDDLGSGLQNDNIIDPYMMATVRNPQAVANQVVITGEVPSVGIKSPLITGTAINDNYLTTQLPVDLTLAQSGLSAVLTPATDIFSPVDVVFIYNDNAVGFDKAAYRTFFYYNGTEEQGTGWYDNDDLGAGLQDGAAVLKAGRAFVIRRAGGVDGTTTFSTPLPYTL